MAKLQYSNIEPNALKAALNATTQKHGSKAVIKGYRRIMDTVRNSVVMQKQWDNYHKDFEYTTDVEFEEACNAVVQLMDSFMGWKKHVLCKSRQSVSLEQYIKQLDVRILCGQER